MRETGEVHQTVAKALQQPYGKVMTSRIRPLGVVTRTYRDFPAFTIFQRLGQIRGAVRGVRGE